MDIALQLWMLRWSYGYCVEVMDVTLKLWMLHWSYGCYVEVMDVTLKLWMLHWSYGYYVEVMDITLKLWILHWSYGYYIEVMDITLKLWILHWSYGYYIEVMDITLKLWMLRWSLTLYRFCCRNVPSNIWLIFVLTVITEIWLYKVFMKIVLFQWQTKSNTGLLASYDLSKHFKLSHFFKRTIYACLDQDVRPKLISKNAPKNI
jgi:hypothetical protein